MIKNSYKTMLTTAGAFIIGILLAYLFEDHYRQFVRFLFSFFNGENIQFTGKNFHLFPSNIFIITSGFFSSFSFLLLKFSTHTSRIKSTFNTVIIFFMTTILITALDSHRLVLECTACNDGIRRLTFNEIPYDRYFVISLALATIYLTIKYLKKTNETYH